MSNKCDGLEVVHEGWLTKSPPTKRIWRARWRKRWFVLRHSGELPGQYYLYYYTDRNCRSLKGQIDLDQCDQVDAGLEFESSKHKYRHMFDVRIPKRTYYLAAETEADMNRWVECVCQVCGLKPYTQGENVYPYGADDGSRLVGVGSGHSESPPVSPSSTASGPYIAISECITGAPLHHHHCPPSSEEFCDSSRRLQPPGHLELRGSGSTTPPLQSPGTDPESVFTDEELNNSKPSVNWETFPNLSESSLEESRPSFNSTTRKYTKPDAPPRPPKPQHLINEQESPLEESSPLYKKVENVVNDMYDFPRSHELNEELDSELLPAPRTKHCYTNPAASQTCENVFRYDFTDIYSGDEPNSPHSCVHYSNVSSPILSGNPPTVHRDLKPGRKTSDSVSNEPSPQQPFVDLNHLRNLKPVPLSKHRDESIPLTLCAPPIRKAEVSSPNTHFHGGQSPNARTFSETSDVESRINDVDEIGTLENSRFSSTSLPSRNIPKMEIQYLDLDLDPNENSNPSNTENSATVYKEVDFVKTEAFNRTRQKVEEERKHCPNVSD